MEEPAVEDIGLCSTTKAMLRYLFFALLLFTSTTLKAQFVVQNNLRTGLVVNNFPKYKYFPKRNFFLINEIKIGSKTQGQKQWHKTFNYPEISLSLFSGNLGNNQQFGYIYAVVPSLNFELLKTKKSSVQATLGWGIGYFTHPYDSLTNPHNILVGYKFAHTVEMSLFYSRKIFQNIYIQFAGSYIHSSNGHYQVPNGGLNLANASIGLKKYFGKPQTFDNHFDSKPKNTEYHIILDYGRHELAGPLFPVGTPKFNVWAIGLFWGKNTNNWLKYYIGFYGKFYNSFLNKIIENDLYSRNKYLKSSIISFCIGAEIMFGRFAVVSYGGLNLYKPFVDKYIYTRIYEYNISNLLELYISSNLGMKYYILNPSKTQQNIFIGFGIKANFGNADYSYLSIGIVL